jgi:hypothetical protein
MAITSFRYLSICSTPSQVNLHAKLRATMHIGRYRGLLGSSAQHFEQAGRTDMVRKGNNVESAGKRVGRRNQKRLNGARVSGTTDGLRQGFVSARSARTSGTNSASSLNRV